MPNTRPVARRARRAPRPSASARRSSGRRLPAEGREEAHAGGARRPDAHRRGPAGRSVRSNGRAAPALPRGQPQRDLLSPPSPPGAGWRCWSRRSAARGHDSMSGCSRARPPGADPEAQLAQGSAGRPRLGSVLALGSVAMVFRFASACARRPSGTPRREDERGPIPQARALLRRQTSVMPRITGRPRGR